MERHLIFFSSFGAETTGRISHPARHLVSVRLSVMIVEDHDGGHHAARNHEHDAVEVGA